MEVVLNQYVCVSSDDENDPWEQVAVGQLTITMPFLPQVGWTIATTSGTYLRADRKPVEEVAYDVQSGKLHAVLAAVEVRGELGSLEIGRRVRTAITDLEERGYEITYFATGGESSA